MISKVANQFILYVSWIFSVAHIEKFRCQWCEKESYMILTIHNSVYKNRYNESLTLYSDLKLLRK